MKFNYHVPTMCVYRKEYIGKKLWIKLNYEVPTKCVLQMSFLKMKQEWNSAIMSLNLCV